MKRTMICCRDDVGVEVCNSLIVRIFRIGAFPCRIVEQSAPQAWLTLNHLR